MALATFNQRRWRKPLVCLATCLIEWVRYSRFSLVAGRARRVSEPPVITRLLVIERKLLSSLLIASQLECHWLQYLRFSA